MLAAPACHSDIDVSLYQVVNVCLDHTIKSDEHGEVSAVTGKDYDQDPRISEKREALQKLAAEIRRIVDEPVEAQGE